MQTAEAKQILDRICRAAETGDGASFSECFTDDGSYHDTFYGEFVGKQRLAEFASVWLYKHAEDLRWDMIDPVVNDDALYARYLFSYTSTLPESKGARAILEGVSIVKLRGTKIAGYSEIINSGTAFADLGFAPERIAKLMLRQSRAIRERAEAHRHL